MIYLQNFITTTIQLNIYLILVIGLLLRNHPLL